MPGLHPLAPNCGAAWSGTSAGTRNQSPAFKNPTSATDGSILRRLSLLRLNAEQKRGQSCGSRKILWVFREFTGLRCERILAHPFNDGVNAGLHVLRLSASSISSQPGTFESLDKVTRIVRRGVSVATSETFVISQRSQTLLRSCCKTSSEKRRTPGAQCMASQAFRSRPGHSGNDFLSGEVNVWRAMLTRLPVAVSAFE